MRRIEHKLRQVISRKTVMGIAAPEEPTGPPELSSESAWTPRTWDSDWFDSVHYEVVIQ